MVDFRHPIQLDLNFARAYAALGSCYESLSETGRAAACLPSAFELRDHAGGAQKLNTVGVYYQNVKTGQLDKAKQTYQEVLQGYPRVTVVVDQSSMPPKANVTKLSRCCASRSSWSPSGWRSLAI